MPKRAGTAALRQRLKLGSGTGGCSEGIAQHPVKAVLQRAGPTTASDWLQPVDFSSRTTEATNT